MKKFIAILLSILCVFSIFTVAASAATPENPFPEKDDMECYVEYKLLPIHDAKLVYNPLITYSFDGPGTLTVTNDTPIAIDHVFAYWVDENGTRYDPGSPIHVEGRVILYAYMVPKSDNNSYLVRVFIAVGEMIVRVFQKAFGVFKVADDFIADYYD